MSKRTANRSGPTRNRGATRKWRRRLWAVEQAETKRQHDRQRQAFQEVVDRMRAREQFSLRSISGRLKDWAMRHFGAKGN